MPANRCMYCEIDWPSEPTYLSCPRCQEPTKYTPKGPIPHSEAEALRKESEFGWWLVAQWLA